MADRERRSSTEQTTGLWPTGGAGKSYRFPTTPPEARIDTAQIRLMDSHHHAMQFRGFADAMVRRIHRRVPEATLMRALRRFTVLYADELLEATSQTTFRGRAITEDDMIEILEHTFRRERGELQRA